MSKAISETSEILIDTWQLMSWQDFIQLGNQPEYKKGRFYYDRGYMKIEMSPLGINHSRDNSVVARLISLFATLKNIPIIELTNVTLRKAEVQESQPDSAFYLGKVANLPTRSNEPINLNQYAPPTLVVEVASTTLSDDLGPKRLLYERLGIHEYWVIDTNNASIIAFEMLEGGSREIQVSKVLPSLQISIVEEALDRSRTSIENLDFENLIEEIESLGKREQRELKNRLTVLLAHLIKRMYVNSPENFIGWELTIREKRQQIKQLLKDSPSLKPYFTERLIEVYVDALEIVRIEYKQAKFPEIWTWTNEIDVLLSKKYWEEQ